MSTEFLYFENYYIMTTFISVTLLIHENKQNLLINCFFSMKQQHQKGLFEMLFSSYLITVVTWTVFNRNMEVDLFFFIFFSCII